MRRSLSNIPALLSQATQSIWDWLKRHRKRLLLVTISGGALMGALGIGFLGSYFVRASDAPLFNLADKAGSKIVEIWQSSTESQSNSNKAYASTFVPLNGKKIVLSNSASGRSGGSLTSWDDRLIAMAQDGVISLIASDHSVEKSKILPPENGYDGYRRVAKQSPYDSYSHNFEWLRYNDIISFQHAEGRGLLVSYTEFSEADTCYASAVARVYVDDVSAETVVTPEDWEVVFRTKPCLPLKDTWRAMEGHMAGGRMVFDGAETAYVTVGDYHWDGVYGPASVPGTDLPTAQDPNSDYGRVIAINLSSGEATHVSRGQRNMQGIAYDRDGSLWTIEHGIRGGDELNRVVAGQNYGWPYETYGTLYSGLPVPDTLSYGRHETYVKPAISWLPSIATSGLTLIEGFHEAWDGDLLVASLAGQKLARVRVAEDRVIFTEFIEIGERIRYVHQHTTGEIVLFTDRGSLIFLTPREGGVGAEFVETTISQLGISSARKTKLRTAIGACGECHSLNRNEDTNAPSLADVFGARIGSSDYSNYSSAMKSANRRWTKELLIAYLKDPEAIVPGTIMPAPNIDDEVVLEALVDVLAELKNEVE